MADYSFINTNRANESGLSTDNANKLSRRYYSMYGKDRKGMEAMEEGRSLDKGAVAGAVSAESSAAGGKASCSTGGSISVDPVKKAGSFKRQEAPKGDITQDSANNSTALDADFKLDFTKNTIINSIILAEVLGKPKYLQKRRW